jgi:hypothetical protein
MKKIDFLLGDCFGADHAFRSEFEQWMQSSRRFRAFVDDHCTKIRAKVKSARNDESMLDLRAEFYTAALLLQEERFTLAYETYAATKQRGPDFTVTFKGHTPFHVEVRRIRSSGPLLEDADARRVKLVAVLCDKAGQLPPGTINLLWLFAEEGFCEADLSQAMAALRLRAERKDEDFFLRRGLAGVGSFLELQRRLSGIVLHQDTTVFWSNPSARRNTPSEVVSAIRRLHAL